MRFINGIVQWGIIGCGNVCEVKSGPAFGKVENSRLVAVMRRNISKAEDYAKRHQVPKFYGDASQLINDPDVNAVYVATPPAFHEMYTIEALKAGKAVYVEKPVALNGASCERMLTASRQYRVPVSGAYYRRALPLFKEVRSLIHSGAVGKVRLIQLSLLQPPVNNLIAETEENWRVDPALSGGGLFHDLAPHQLDILYWIFGKPKEVRGRSLNQSGMYNAPDLTSLEAFFDNEVCLQGIWSFNAPVAEDRCRIIGSEGVVSFAFFRNPTLEICSAAGDTKRIDFEHPAHIQAPMIADVVKFFSGKAANPCPLEEVQVSMEMMDCTV